MVNLLSIKAQEDREGRPIDSPSGPSSPRSSAQSKPFSSRSSFLWIPDDSTHQLVRRESIPSIESVELGAPDSEHSITHARWTLSLSDTSTAIHRFGLDCRVYRLSGVNSHEPTAANTALCLPIVAAFRTPATNGPLTKLRTNSGGKPSQMSFQFFANVATWATHPNAAAIQSEIDTSTPERRPSLEHPSEHVSITPWGGLASLVISVNQRGMIARYLWSPRGTSGKRQDQSLQESYKLELKGISK